MEEVAEYPKGGDERQDEHLVRIEIVSSGHVPDVGVGGGKDSSQEDSTQAAVEDEDGRGDFLALGDQHVRGGAGDGTAQCQAGP